MNPLPPPLPPWAFYPFPPTPWNSRAVLLGAGTAFVVLGSLAALMWLRPPGSALPDDTQTSIARYLNAQGTLGRAWGPWSLVIGHRQPSAPFKHSVIIGLDTQARCESVARVFEKYGDRASCTEATAN